jgi:hypothetical protein
MVWPERDEPGHPNLAARSDEAESLIAGGAVAGAVAG